MSAKTDTGISLNDVQYTGPTIQNELFSILLRFWQYHHVFTADIVKMYPSFNCWENQIIFWRENESDPLDVYQLKSITYGETSASYLATRSLTQLAYDIRKTNTSIVKIIRLDFYIDDLLTGADTLEKLTQVLCKI